MNVNEIEKEEEKEKHNKARMVLSLGSRQINREPDACPRNSLKHSLKERVYQAVCLFYPYQNCSEEQPRRSNFEA